MRALHPTRARREPETTASMRSASSTAARLTIWPTRAQVAAGLRPHRMRGMTLIELMVVVAIVAILASLAVGSYRRYVLRANRTDATSALLRIQVGEEKYFLQNNAYTINATAQPP